MKPKYKIRSEGDSVQAGDRILLESKLAVGNYLSYSSRKFDHNAQFSIEDDRLRLHQVGDLEGTASATMKAWTIQVFVNR